MPALTNIEDAFLSELHGQAESLQNGNRGDLLVMSDVIGKTAKVVVAMARTGGVSPTECDAKHAQTLAQMKAIASRSDWKKTAAWAVPLCGVVFGIVWKVIAT